MGSVALWYLDPAGGPPRQVMAEASGVQSIDVAAGAIGRTAAPARAALTPASPVWTGAAVFLAVLLVGFSMVLVISLVRQRSAE